jgi:hypothetical protein
MNEEASSSLGWCAGVEKARTGPFRPYYLFALFLGLFEDARQPDF